MTRFLVNILTIETGCPATVVILVPGPLNRTVYRLLVGIHRQILLLFIEHAVQNFNIRRILLKAAINSILEGCRFPAGQDRLLKNRSEEFDDLLIRGCILSIWYQDI